MEEDNIHQLIALAQEDREYRSSLLIKYADILSRSECRVDQVNKMIGNLIKLETQLTLLFDNLTREQQHVADLISELKNKQRHIDHLEACRKEDHERFMQLFQQLINTSGTAKVNENNFHMG